MNKNQIIPLLDLQADKKRLHVKELQSFVIESKRYTLQNKNIKQFQTIEPKNI